MIKSIWNYDEEDDEDELPEGTTAVDWKADPETVLEEVDCLLQKIGYEIELFDEYVFRIIPKGM